MDTSGGHATMVCVVSDLCDRSRDDEKLEVASHGSSRAAVGMIRVNNKVWSHSSLQVSQIQKADSLHAPRFQVLGIRLIDVVEKGRTVMIVWREECASVVRICLCKE